MTFFLLCLCLLCLTGCGKGKNPQRKSQGIYPALTESPAPLLSENRDFSENPVETPEPQAIPSNDMPESWMEKQLKKETLIKSLKEQAARAGPDDPFALSEEAIEELSKSDDLSIH